MNEEWKQDKLNINHTLKHKQGCSFYSDFADGDLCNCGALENAYIAITHHDQRLAEEIEGMKKLDDNKLIENHQDLSDYGYDQALSAVQEKLKGKTDES